MDTPRALLGAFRDRAKSLSADALKIKVCDQESQIAATNLAANIKSVAKSVEDARKEYS